jgi:hypothetical protein
VRSVLPEIEKKEDRSLLQQQVFEVLAYFDVFKHPLAQHEIQRIIGADNDTLLLLLNDLCLRKVIFVHAQFYSMDADIETLVHKRTLAEKLAKEYLPKLEKYQKIIASFPFVRGIAVSGSLSKGVMHENGDIDFFIITQPGRLWICRSLLVAYKKFRLLNSRKYFCLNYFVDTNNLEIRDKNIFTFMELFHLMPVFSEHNTLGDFFKANAWMEYYFPAFRVPALDASQASNARKNRTEKLLAGRWGDMLEHLAHRLTLKRWRKKFAHFNSEKFELTMRSTIGVSKHHPRDFQSRVLLVYADKLDQLLQR